MRPFPLLYFTSFAFVYSYSEEEYHHSLKKRSASPQLVLTGQQIDPATAIVGGGALLAGGFLVNHLLGDPGGKAIKNHFGKKKNNRRPAPRPPTNVEHHHHHYVPEYDTEEAYWYDWSPWQNGVCSRSCGTGTMNQRRRRDCSQGPNGCSGHAEETQQASCNSHECPVDGFWLAYSEWQDNGVCSRSCGGGTRLLVRHRQCQGPYGGGRACHGSSEDTKSIQCSPQACPTNGIWGAWNVLSTGQSCRATCGAGTVVQARERTCVGPYNGGRPCVGESYTERCVEDNSYRTEGHYTANPGVPTVNSNPRPSYGVGNGAIKPRHQGRALDDEIAHGEVEKPVYDTTRNPRQSRTLHDTFIKNSSNTSSSLSLYDAILTPTGNGNSRQAIKKPVYGPANSN